MPKVMVIEADERLRNLLRAFLLTQGFGVTLARDAGTASRSLEHDPPDVLLLELDGLDAPETVLAALQSGAPDRPPVIAITNDDLPPDRRRALGVPILRKPFDADELVLLLTDAVERAGPARLHGDPPHPGRPSPD